tara:strand:- start:1818 stop:2030 length:213 start_codon:yes stop_codon:yes gene_type:complete
MTFDDIQKLKQRNDLSASECDALLKLILGTPNRITDKLSDEFNVNFRQVRHKLGRLADIQDGNLGYVVKG